MTTKREMLAKAKKIAAYKELLRIAKEEPFKYNLKPLISKNFSSSDRELLLSRLLDDYATMLESDDARHEIRLLLDAGANPNYIHYDNDYGGGRMAIFDRFIKEDNYSGAAEIAKTEGFVGPENQAMVFKRLSFYSPCESAGEVVRVLFSKDMKPYNPQTRNYLQNTYLPYYGGRSGVSR